MIYPIPDAALDDRLGFVGTSGAGKTYAAGTAVERLLARGSRVIIPDALGVWFGLRLAADGKRPSRFNVVIFGGPHGDLPITENAGKLIGETVAGMAESCIVDLSGLGTKAAERRFMLAFLTALHSHASGEPVHLIFDESDLWAPQQIRDREQDPAKLLGVMETIVRRGRVKGFIPWLISQRPAVINKDVLSQADGLIAFKLTSSQDRKALGAWIEGQADADQGKEILASLPTMQRGQGVVWIPGRGVLATATFPQKITFDSSRTPGRGEAKHTAALAPIDLATLKDRLASVEAETKANDPVALKAEIAKLKRELQNRPQNITKNITDHSALAAEFQRGFGEGIASTRALAVAALTCANQVAEHLHDLMTKIESIPVPPAHRSPRNPAGNATGPRNTGKTAEASRAMAQPQVSSRGAGSDDALTNSQRKVLGALMWWRRLGHHEVTRVQIATVCGWKVTSSNIRDRLSELSTRGLVSYPRSGMVTLTDEGHVAAPLPPDVDGLTALRSVMSNAQIKIFEQLAASGDMIKSDLATACGWSPDSSNIRDRCSELSSLEIVHYPVRGRVDLTAWVKELL
jgi:hypothetical protein